MSKMDALRAMREARFEQAAARNYRPAPSTPSRRRPDADPVKSVQATEPQAEPLPSEERLCGHRAISGRTCTREAGHAAKSHRYS